MSSVADAHPATRRERLAGRIAPVKERTEAFLKRWEWTWTTAVLFSLGLTFFIMITVAVIPSFWLYFADQKLKWDGGAPHKILPFLPWTLEGFWLKEIRDAVAMGLSTVPLVVVLVGAAVLQNWRRKLRGAQSEARPTGGYR
jgi:hypothetical protein